MARHFFSGSSVAKLDEKNRFVLPQEMRFGLVENGVLQFTIALGLGGCLCIYKQSDMEKIVAKFMEKQHLAQFQKFFTLFFSTLHKTECDRIGRVVLPEVLLKAGQIKKKIVLAGVIDRIEIWPEEKYMQDLEMLFSGKKEGRESLGEMCEQAFALLHTKEEVL